LDADRQKLIVDVLQFLLQGQKAFFSDDRRVLPQPDNQVEALSFLFETFIICESLNLTREPYREGFTRF